MLAEEMQILLTKAGTLSFINYFEIAVLLLAALTILRLLLKTRAATMAKGFLLLLALLGLTAFCNLRIISFVLDRFLYFFVICGAVLFAPELRHFLEKLGSLDVFMKKKIATPSDISEMLEAVGDAVGNLSRRQVGALICFEKQASLQEFIDSGIMVDGICTSGLLINIFEKNTPLHDGAVIIRQDRVVAATCYLPLTEQYLSKNYGTRHRAALGLSEVSDALVVVVSEETGNIAAARAGQLLQFLTPEDVMALMVEHLYGKENIPALNAKLAACFAK